jgi:hypothetical protein
VAVGVSAVACRRADERAVDETMAFAAASVSGAAAAAESERFFQVVVDDSAVERYTKVFAYFDPKDTTRARAYRTTPITLLWNLTNTEFERIERRRAGDTTMIRVRMQRPEWKLLEQRVANLVFTGDSTPPTADQQTAFRAALQRVRRELQEADTAIFWIVDGPRIAAVRTTRGIRDSVVRDSIAKVERVRIARFAEGARLGDFEVSDYSRLAAISRGGMDGGSVRGTITPAPGGWPKQDPSQFVSTEVHCEGSNGTDVVRGTSYLSEEELEKPGKSEFLCLWTSLDREWRRVRPTTFRVRFVALNRANRDTIAGAWYDIPASAVR